MGGHVAWKPAPEEAGAGTILDINGSNGDNNTLLSYRTYVPRDIEPSSTGYICVAVRPESINVGNALVQSDGQYAQFSELGYEHLSFSNDYEQAEFSMYLGEYPTFKYAYDDKIEYMYWPASDTDVDSYLGIKTDN